MPFLSGMNADKVNTLHCQAIMILDLVSELTFTKVLRNCGDAIPEKPENSLEATKRRNNSLQFTGFFFLPRN